ncbi:ATP-binding protein [Luteitalea sp.]|uniref:ATP-binding protein n=1 Tax=Luteitalea sp. TaxID=2004800 RepID=UPI0025C41BFE|nr:ATP-binding protein [Luteitalea sp.]
MLETYRRPSVHALRPLASAVVLGGIGRLLQLVSPSLGDGIVLRLDEPFWLLAGWALGPVWGALAALVATGGSAPLPLALTFVAEALCFGALARRGVMAVLAVAPFWIAADALVAAGVLALPLAATAKQTVNAVLSAVVAKGLLMVPGARRGLGLAPEAADQSLRDLVRRALVPAVAASLALLVLGLGRLYADALERAGIQAMSLAADNVALRLADYIKAAEGDVRLLTGHLSLDAVPVQGLSRILLLHHETSAPQFLTMLVSDEHGHVLAASRRYEGAVSALPGGASVGDRPYFSEPAHTGQPFTSNGFRGRNFGTDPIVAISAPYRDARGQFAGVVEGSLDLGQFGAWLQQFAPPAGASLMVIDAAGQVVASSGPDRVALLQDGTSLSQVRTSQSGHAAPFFDPADQDAAWSRARHVAVRRDIAESGWQVHLRQSVRDMQAPLVVFYWTCTLWLIACLLVAPPLAGWVSRRIAGPLEELAHTAQAIGRSPDAPVPDVPRTAPREVRLLRNELGTMAATLSHTLASLDHKVQERTAELAAATARNDTVFAAAMDGMVMLRGGRIAQVNDAFCRMTGRSRDELVTLAVQDLAPGVPPEVRAERRAQLASAGQARFEAALRTQDRGDIPVEVVVTAVPHAPGHSFAVVRDVSERQQLEAQLRQSQKLEAVGTLAGGIAHEFNNVLALVSGNVELSQSELPAEHPVQSHLSSASRAAARAASLVRRILAFSQDHDERRELVQVAPIVSDVATLLRAAVPSMIAVRTEIEKQLPPIVADPAQLQQVLLSLGSNAADAMPHGGELIIRASARRSGDDPGTRRVELTVTDTGTGMNRQTMERAFEPFFTTKPVGTGTGLGLSMAHGIVTSHGGTIEISSQPGHGTAVHVSLPAATQTVGAPVPAAPGSGSARVLVVDDEPEIVEILTRQLTLMGYAVDGRNGPHEALDALGDASQPYAAVVSDLAMPTMTGLELAEAIRRLHPDVAFVLCSGRLTDADRERASALGVAGVLEKPFSGRRLAEVLGQVVPTTTH